MGKSYEPPSLLHSPSPNLDGILSTMRQRHKLHQGQTPLSILREICMTKRTKQIHKLFGAKAIEKFNEAFAKDILALHRPDKPKFSEAFDSPKMSAKDILAVHRGEAFVSQYANLEKLLKQYHKAKRDKDCERLAKILGITSDLKSGRYKMLAKDILALHKPDKDCDTIKKMFCDCGRPIKFSDVFNTELDCVATEQAQSKTPNLKRKT